MHTMHILSLNYTTKYPTATMDFYKEKGLRIPKSYYIMFNYLSTRLAVTYVLAL